MNKESKIIAIVVAIVGLTISLAFCDTVSIADIKGKVHGAITDAHARIHQGQLYSGTTIFASVVDDGYARVLVDITTDTFTSSEIHIVFSMTSASIARAQLYEDVSCSSSGTLITARNFNRGIADSTTTIKTLIYANPTAIVSSGTLISEILVPAGGIGMINGGQARSGIEWVLKGSSTTGKSYIYRIQNKDGSAAKPMAINVEFYEVE